MISVVHIQADTENGQDRQEEERKNCGAHDRREGRESM